MKIGIAAPAEVRSLHSYFQQYSLNELPRGYGGTMIPTYLAEGLIKRGHTVSIYTSDPFITEPKILEGGQLSIYIGKYRSPARFRMIDLFKAESEFIKQAIEQDKPDIVNAHWTYEFAFGALMTGIPTLVTARDAPFWILQYQFNLYRFVRLLLVWRVIRRTKHLSVVSPYIADHIKKCFIYKNDIKIIPNAIPLEPKDKLRTNKRNKKKLIIFSIANGWGKRKNTKRLLEAFSMVHHEFPIAELWMFGAGHGPGEAAFEWAEKRNLLDGVEFMGRVKHAELMKLLEQNADILVHPSLEESFGNIFLEAGKFAVPIIAGKYSGAVPYTLGNGKAGLLVDVRSAEELSTGMLLFARNKNMREAYGRSAQAYVYGNYSIEGMIDAYEKAYYDILSR